MTEYIERNQARDVVAGLATMRFELSNAYRVYIEALKNVDAEVMKIPAADVVKVVRCKDCRHRDPEDKKCDCGGTERQGCRFPVDDDYFCAYGERKKDD